MPPVVVVQPSVSLVPTTSVSPPFGCVRVSVPREMVKTSSLSSTRVGSSMPVTRSSASGSRSSAGFDTSSGGNSVGQYAVGGTLTWEIDVWGRIRRQIESDSAAAQASAADLMSARLSAQSSLVTNYFSLRISDARRRVLEESVAAYGRSLEIVRNQFNAGTMTMRTPNARLRPTDALEVAPVDATRLGLAAGQSVRVTSRYGEAVLPVDPNPRVIAGQLFATFSDPARRLNEVIGPGRDPVTHTPEYKITAVSIEAV